MVMRYRSKSEISFPQSFHSLLTQNEKCITVYDTRTGDKDKEMAYKPMADDNAHEDYAKESTVEGVCYLSNSDCIIVSVAITDKTYSSFYKLICFDLKTDEVIAKSPGSISQNSKMTVSKVSYCSFCILWEGNSSRSGLGGHGGRGGGRKVTGSLLLAVFGKELFGAKGSRSTGCSKCERTVSLVFLGTKLFYAKDRPESFSEIDARVADPCQ